MLKKTKRPKKEAVKNLLEYVSLDAMMEFTKQEEVEEKKHLELLSEYVANNPRVAAEALNDAYKITVLEEIMDEAERRLAPLKKKRAMSQSQALRQLESYNRTGVTE